MIGPVVEPAIVYSIVRQESWFNPRTVSSANALGLMQVTPAAGRYVASKFKVPFDQKRLLNDSTYNVQMGAAELGSVISDYRGSYIMAFAAYNAGPARIRKLRKEAQQQGYDPNKWFNNVEYVVADKIGRETVNYVSNIYKYYIAYQLILAEIKKRESALEQMQ